MSDIKLIVRTADRARKAEIELPPQMTGGDVIQAAVEKWRSSARQRLLAGQRHAEENDEPI